VSLVYCDSSALVKLVVDEPESAALAGWIEGAETMAASRLAVVEVDRATRIANPSEAVARDTRRVLESCLLVDVSRAILGDASRLTSVQVRTLDAIHLATALRLEAEVLVGYDERLADAARARGLRVVAPR
jgi:predicted nucleic acid-binding protein